LSFLRRYFVAKNPAQTVIHFGLAKQHLARQIKILMMGLKKRNKNFPPPGRKKIRKA
jgi:hypothetical protein